VAERSAELSAATSDRLRRQKQPAASATTCPGRAAVLSDLVLDGLVARLAAAKTRTGSQRY